MLSKTEKGQQYINLYYQNNPKILSLMLANPELVLKTGRLLRNSLPELQMLVSGRGSRALLRETQLRESKELFSLLSAAADPDLKAALSEVNRDILNKAVAGQSLASVMAELGL